MKIVNKIYDEQSNHETAREEKPPEGQYENSVKNKRSTQLQ